MLNNDRISFEKQEHKIRELLAVNAAYQKKLIKYENIFNDLESQINSLKSIKRDCLLKEEIYQKEKIELAKKEQKIMDLEADIINLKLEHEKYKNKKELEYENDVNAVKNLYDTNLLKNKTAQVVEETNKQFYEQILKLENIIINFKEEQKKIDAKKEIEFEKRMSKMKKKMLDYIKEGQKSKQFLSKEQIRLNDKFSVINKNTLLNELGFQSMQLEDLLKQRAHLDSIITGMREDLEIHRKVEKILTEKNKDYTNMIKVLSSKIETKKNKDENIKNLSTKNSIKKELDAKMNPIKLVNPNSKFIRINNAQSFDEKNRDKNESNDFKLNLNEEIKVKNFGKTSIGFTNKMKVEDINESQDLVFLRKELIKKIKESEDYKSKFEYYKTKLDSLNSKYLNLMKLFEGVLVNIYNDKNMSNIKNIFINLEDFKQCNFESLSSEQKYSIVILIIKYLMPLINPNNLPDKFKSLFSNVEDVTFITDRPDKGNYLISNSSNLSSKYKERINKHYTIKSRIKSSSSDFGKTQIFFDNKYQQQVNNFDIRINPYNIYENNRQKRNKKLTNKNFLKFLSKRGSQKDLGLTNFGNKYSSLLTNFFSSLEAENFNNIGLKKSYSLINV